MHVARVMNMARRDENLECSIRLDAAINALTLSSELLKDVIFSGSEEAIQSAYASLRLARMRFLEARADCREMVGMANTVQLTA
jgi:hypothetical protein